MSSTGHLYRELATYVENHLKHRGWSLSRVARLPEAYMLDQPTTPFFRWLDNPRREGQELQISASVGVIHRPFEEYWDQLAPEKSPDFALALHLANLVEIYRASWINIERMESDSAKFCSALTDILEAWPRSEGELRHAFQDGAIGGIRIEGFDPFFRPKSIEMKRFVLKS